MDILQKFFSDIYPEHDVIRMVLPILAYIALEPAF